MASAPPTRSGFGWVSELGTIPEIALNPKTSIVVPVEIAGNLLLSSEAINDADANLLNAVGEAVSDGLGPTVDRSPS